MREQFFGGNFFGGMFYMGTNDKTMQGSKLVSKRFQRSSEVFPLIDSNLGYWYIILKVNFTNRGLNLKSIFCTLCLWVGDFM